MTTSVHTTVVAPNVHRARVSVQDKQADGTWVEAHGHAVELGETKFVSNYITNTRRIVIEEVPLNSA